MPGSETKAKFRTPGALGFNSGSWAFFDNVAAVGASVVGTAIQQSLPLPCTCKIYGAMVAYTAIGATTGTHFFNIVLGNASYETTNGALSTVPGTVAGTIHTGDTIVMTWSVAAALVGSVGGPTPATPIIFTVSYTVKSTDTTATLVALGVCNAFNSTEILNALFFANQAAGVVNFTSIGCGTIYNGVTYTAIVTGTAVTTTFTASGTTASGTNNTGYATIGPNNTIPIGQGPSFAAQGTPIFDTDQALFAVAPGTTLQGQFPYTTFDFDTLYPQGSVLSLRAITPAGGSITNFKVGLLIAPYDPINSHPNVTAFDPNQDVG